MEASTAKEKMEQMLEESEKAERSIDIPEKVDKKIDSIDNLLDKIRKARLNLNFYFI